MKKLFCFISFVVLSVSCSSQQPEENITEPEIALSRNQVIEKYQREYVAGLTAVKHGPQLPKPEDVDDMREAREAYIYNVHALKYLFGVSTDEAEKQMVHEYIKKEYADLIESREAFITANLFERVLKTDPFFMLDKRGWVVREERQKKEQSKTRLRL